MAEENNQVKKKTRLQTTLKQPRSRLTPKERDALWLVAGLFLLGCLIRIYRAHGGF